MFGIDDMLLRSPAKVTTRDVKHLLFSSHWCWRLWLWMFSWLISIFSWKNCFAQNREHLCKNAMFCANARAIMLGCVCHFLLCRSEESLSIWSLSKWWFFSVSEDPFSLRMGKCMFLTSLATNLTRCILYGIRSTFTVAIKADLRLGMTGMHEGNLFLITLWLIL